MYVEFWGIQDVPHNVEPTTTATGPLNMLQFHARKCVPGYAGLYNVMIKSRRNETFRPR